MPETEKVNPFLFLSMVNKRTVPKKAVAKKATTKKKAVSDWERNSKIISAISKKSY